MSAQKLLNFFEELLHSPEKGENIEEITSKSLALFTEIAEQIKTADPSERVKISQELAQVGTKMNEEFETLCQQFGLSREDLELMVNDPGNYDTETWGSIQHLKKEIDEKKQGIFHDQPSGGKKGKKRKKLNKKWLTA